MPVATFINMLAVLIGGTIGLVVGNRLPENIKKIVFQAIGLFTFVLGIGMALEINESLLMVFSLILGGIIGETIRLEKQVDGLGQWLKTKLKSNNDRFAEGLTTTFLLFCVGSMTIVGAIKEGLEGDQDLLLTKSVLDGFTAIALATIYGSSVLVSVIPMLIFQGGITLLAFQAKALFNEALIQDLGAVGGVLIIGIALNILEIKKINVLNLLPALVIIILLLFLKPYFISWFSFF